MSWLDQIRQRIYEVKERRIPTGDLTYTLYRGIEDQVWMMDMLEEARDLLATRANEPAAGPPSGGAADKAQSWIERLQKGPFLDETGQTRAWP